jgi:putative transposase
VLEVSRSGYYAWIELVPSERAKEDFVLSAEIKEIFHSNEQGYGSPRVYKELRANGHQIGKKRVERLTKKNELEAKPSKKYCRTTGSNHTMPIAENLLQRDFTDEEPNEKRVGDVTYVRTNEGWLSVAAILDLYSRRVVGWRASERNDAELVMKVLRQAIKQRRPPRELVMHSDRGSTYASELHQETRRAQAYLQHEPERELLG